MPWLLVLNKYMQQWKAENNDRLPSNYREKSQLREMIRNGMFCLLPLNGLDGECFIFGFSLSGMTNDEENYEEAIKAVNTSFGGGKITSSLKAIFEDDACKNLNKHVSVVSEYCCLMI